jgi:MarR family 2-MHQ and catechol resistance regulon transcriptional repressor
MSSQKAETALQLWDKLQKVHDKFYKSRAKQMFEQKLTSPQFGVLEALYKLGSVPLKKLSQETMVTGANITCVVDNLEEMGFAKRIHSKEDRRVINADLTNSGKNKLDQILPPYYSSIVSISSKLSDKEQKELTSLLNKMLQ